MDTVDIDRGASRDAQAGHFAAMPLLNAVTSITKTPQETDVAVCALTDRRFITHLKFLMLMQRVIVGQNLRLFDEDKDQLHLGHLHMLHLASRVGAREVRHAKFYRLLRRSGIRSARLFTQSARFSQQN